MPSTRRPRAQLAFKNSMVRGILQFTPGIASMKNVAKCDTWCELQNPANHRVFERKLRPRPSGRGHVCLGVTPKDTPNPTLRGGTWRLAPRAAGRGGPKMGLPANRVGHSTWWVTLSCFSVQCPGTQLARCPKGPVYHRSALVLGPRPQVRRDYPLSLSI